MNWIIGATTLTNAHIENAALERGSAMVGEPLKTDVKILKGL